MGGAAPEPGKGGKRSLDAAINLVPYIDLLMTIMTFLVMTAVWTQIAALEIQNTSGGQEQQEKDKDEDPPKPIFVLLTESNSSVQEEGAEASTFPNTANGYDWDGVQAALKSLKEARPERTQVMVKPEDGVKFEDIAKAIDINIGLELTGVQLQPASQ